MMLINDILQTRIILEFDESLLQQSIDELILVARMDNKKKINISNLINEINNEYTDIYLDSKDLEVRKKIATLLQNNKWAEVQGNMIYLTSPGDVKKPKDNVDKNERVSQERKVEKIATNNLKKRHKNGGSILGS